MKLPVTETKAFSMYDAIDYPEHMRTPEQREEWYEKVVEAFDMVSDMSELEEFEKEFMNDMKQMGNYKYMAFRLLVAEKKLNYLDSIPY